MPEQQVPCTVYNRKTFFCNVCDGVIKVTLVMTDLHYRLLTQANLVPKVYCRFEHHCSRRPVDSTYHAQHCEFYEDLLDDARQTHVILQDMTQRRTWHTDGQRFILHAILNRHSLKPYRVDCKLVKFDSAVCNQPDSVSGSMVQNRDLILRRDQHLDKEDVQVKLYRDEVRELYQMLEGLQAETENVSEAGIELKLSWEQQLQGWNYVEFLQRKHRMKVHETELRKTCGQRPAFARDNGAVVFFADNFNDVIQPATSASLCNKFKNVPQDKDYLTIQTSTLYKLVELIIQNENSVY